MKMMLKNTEVPQWTQKWWGQYIHRPDTMKRQWSERAGCARWLCYESVLTSSLRLLTSSTPPGPECPDNATLPAAAAAAAAALRGLMAPTTWEKRRREEPRQPHRSEEPTAQHLSWTCPLAMQSTCLHSSTSQPNTTHLWQTHIPEPISAIRGIAIWVDFTQTGTPEPHPKTKSLFGPLPLSEVSRSIGRSALAWGNWCLSVWIASLSEIRAPN